MHHLRHLPSGPMRTHNDATATEVSIATPASAAASAAVAVVAAATATAVGAAAAAAVSAAATSVTRRRRSRCLHRGAGLPSTPPHQRAWRRPPNRHQVESQRFAGHQRRLHGHGRHHGAFEVATAVATPCGEAPSSELAGATAVALPTRRRIRALAGSRRRRWRSDRRQGRRRRAPP